MNIRYTSLNLAGSHLSNPRLPWPIRTSQRGIEASSSADEEHGFAPTLKSANRTFLHAGNYKTSLKSDLYSDGP